MGTKLYVANLPFAPSALALRTHFSTCGIVSDVQIVADRNVGRGRGSAFIRMGNKAGAERALAELNGAPFAGQFLLVEAAPDDGTEERAPRGSRKTEQTDGDSKARITLQFRESSNMTYELDCSGLALMIRIFFPSTTGQWRIAVQTSRDAEAPSAAAAAESRLEAFRELARASRETTDTDGLRGIDWEAIEQALTKVRAL
jgi:RNA recognition motif-containing protein